MIPEPCQVCSYPLPPPHTPLKSPFFFLTNSRCSEASAGAGAGTPEFGLPEFTPQMAADGGGAVPQARAPPCRRTGVSGVKRGWGLGRGIELGWRPILALRKGNVEPETGL